MNNKKKTLSPKKKKKVKDPEAYSFPLFLQENCT
jgi:hypothetical protein